MSPKQATQRLEQLSRQLSPSPGRVIVAELVTNVNALLAEGKNDEASLKALQAYLRPPRFRSSSASTAVLDDAEKSTVQVEGIKIQRYIWNPDAKSTIIITHGFSFSAAFMTPTIQHIRSTSKHRIVAVDQAAHGSSGGDEASLSHFIIVIRRLVDDELARGNRVASLIGHSVGASAIVMTLASYGDIFPLQSDRPSIVLISPPLQPLTNMEVFCRQHSLPLLLLKGMHTAFKPYLEDTLAPSFVKESWAKGLKILVVQDADDTIARPNETEQLAARLELCGSDMRLEKTSKLGHFKTASDKRILALLSGYV